VDESGKRTTFRGEWVFEIEDQKHSIYLN